MIQFLFFLMPRVWLGRMRHNIELEGTDMKVKSIAVVILVAAAGHTRLSTYHSLCRIPCPSNQIAVVLSSTEHPLLHVEEL